MFISEGNTTEREYKPVPAGTHLAIAYGIVDLGTQQYVYKGEQKQSKMLRLFFELHGDDDNILELDDGRPMSISQRYTKSLHEKSKLRQHIVSWRGGKDFTPEELGQVRGQKGWDIRTLLGKHCMLSVKHSTKPDGRTFANVDGITSVPAIIRKLGLPGQVNKSIYFSFDEFSDDAFSQVSQGIQKIIMQSPEYQRASRTPVMGRPSKQAEAEDWFDKHEQLNGNKGMEDDDIPFN